MGTMRGNGTWNRKENGYLFGMDEEEEVGPAHGGGGAGVQRSALLRRQVAVV